MSDPADPYGPEVRRLFRAPAHAGTLEAADRVRVEGQGVAVELCMLRAGPAIRQLRFLAWGCPHFIAAAEALCRDYEGRAVAELAGYSAVETVRTLPVPRGKTGRILVLEDAARALAGSAGITTPSKTGVPPP
ncbi:MAG TPA: iron-sulfur cluster assembly scaffold protein [Woeseiaceae bacterium]|nr:iron-sulfur cluster assembly scaffold protein [Woeseiaceae bacterium]